MKHAAVWKFLHDICLLLVVCFKSYQRIVLAHNTQLQQNVSVRHAIWHYYQPHYQTVKVFGIVTHQLSVVNTATSQSDNV